MKCKECDKKMKKILVDVEGARSKVISYQCSCGYFEFDKKSGNKVIEEIKSKSESPLKIKQKVIKISHNRLGTYFNENIVRSLNLKAGEEIYVTIPDNKHILISIEEK